MLAWLCLRNLNNAKYVKKYLFTSEYLEEKFEDKNGKINRWLAYCTDSNELLERIAMLRGKELKDLVQKAGFDDGKSFLKLTMTIYDPEDIIPCDGNFVKTGDLKIYLIILHLTSSSSRHPCPFCLTYKDENGVWVDSPLRTLEGIIESYEEWQKSGGKKENVKEFYNSAGVPLLKPKSDGQLKTSM